MNKNKVSLILSSGLHLLIFISITSLKKNGNTDGEQEKEIEVVFENSIENEIEPTHVENKSKKILRETQRK